MLVGHTQHDFSLNKLKLHNKKNKKSAEEIVLSSSLHKKHAADLPGEKNNNK